MFRNKERKSIYTDYSKVDRKGFSVPLNMIIILIVIIIYIIFIK